VDFCYLCLPGGPFVAPPCRRCGSRRDYFSAGLCRLCHRYSTQPPHGCPDCYAWGTTRKLSWRCRGCVGWQNNHRLGRCICCHREVHVNAERICRLCWRQAAMLGQSGDVDGVRDANRHGQQLFLANMHQGPQGSARLAQRSPTPAARSVAPVLRIAEHRQLVLLDLPRDLATGRRHGLPPPPDPQTAELLFATLREHAAGHGWSARTTKKARRGLEIMLGLQDTPGAPIPASLVYQLPSIELPARLLAEFLAGLGLLDDDRTPAIQTWFANQIAGLPEPMRRELSIWADIMWTGRSTHPRSRPRAQKTMETKLRWALPTLNAWAMTGVKSLREISREHVLAVLPPSGNPRYTAGAGLHAIFKVLKAHQVVFVDPTARLKLGSPESRTPLPADLAVIRDGLASPDPTRAAITALLAFHALRSGQIRRLQLTEVRDGRLHLPGQTILLAEPVRVRLAAYLDHRNRRWPHTANPHLFIHYRTALGTAPVGGRWLGLILGTAARVIRTDRILDEVIATGGDIRRICDLFGLSVKAAIRYTAVLDHHSASGTD
jgi:hypothetical protein